MQVTPKSAEGLSRTFGVSIPAAELGAMLEARIDEVTPTLRLKGFRPGKVPKAHVRRLYGKALMGEVLEKTLSETSQKVVEDNSLRIAAQPQLEPRSDMEKVLAGQADLDFDLSVEVMPEFEPTDIAKLKLERPVLPVAEAEVDAQVAELAAQNRAYEPRARKAKAEMGDQLLIDFEGRIDGAPFEGGSAQDVELVLGSGRFLPGFEEQLQGAVAGDKRTVTATFPEEYPVARLSGKAAEFDVTVKEARAPVEAAPDDALAQRLGMADLAALRAALRGNLEREYGAQSRAKAKRALLDALDTAHAPIALPGRMVEAEFSGIWAQLEHEKEHGHMSEEDAGKSEEQLRAEYRRIAERRVRLGLVLAEIGRLGEVTVSEQELNDALRREAMRYGEQAQRVFDALRKDPGLQAQARAPLYEEKVVDYILGKAQVTDRPVSREELYKEDELPEGIEEPAEKPKKRAKAKAEPAPAPEPVPEEKAAAKAKAKAQPEPESKPVKAERAAAKPKPKAKGKAK